MTHKAGRCGLTWMLPARRDRRATVRRPGSGRSSPPADEGQRSVGCSTSACIGLGGGRLRQPDPKVAVDFQRHRGRSATPVGLSTASWPMMSRKAARRPAAPRGPSRLQLPTAR